MLHSKLINKSKSKKPEHRVDNLVWLTLGTLLITLVIMAVALWLYRISGTAQLDLSRPEFNGVRQQAKVTEDDEFESSGTITRGTVNDFMKLFKARAEKIDAIKAFGPEPLSDQALSLE